MHVGVRKWIVGAVKKKDHVEQAGIRKLQTTKVTIQSLKRKFISTMCSIIKALNQMKKQL